MQSAPALGWRSTTLSTTSYEPTPIHNKTQKSQSSAPPPTSSSHKSKKPSINCHDPSQCHVYECGEARAEDTNDDWDIYTSVVSSLGQSWLNLAAADHGPSLWFCCIHSTQPSTPMIFYVLICPVCTTMAGGMLKERLARTNSCVTICALF